VLVKNIFAATAVTNGEEVFEELLRGGEFTFERIVSTGQVTPEGQWYDQPAAEWVVLLSGGARLRFEEEEDELELCPGDCVNIPAHCRHRVEWTDPDEQTVWLALHYRPASLSSEDVEETGPRIC